MAIRANTINEDSKREKEFLIAICYILESEIFFLEISLDPPKEPKHKKKISFIFIKSEEEFFFINFSTKIKIFLTYLPFSSEF